MENHARTKSRAMKIADSLISARTIVTVAQSALSHLSGAHWAVSRPNRMCYKF